MKCTVLVVDDQPINRKFLATLLGYAGHRVIEAADGAEALDMALAHDPNLVISDILMPTMDGIELVNRMRAHSALANTPVIFYTATYRVSEARLLAFSCGVSTVIAKPAEPQAILQAVIDALGVSAQPLAVNVAGLAARGGGAQPVFVAERLSVCMRDLVELLEHMEGTNERALSVVGKERELPQLADRVLHSFTRVQALCMRLAALIELSQDLSLQHDSTELIHLLSRAGQDIVSAKYAVVGMWDDGGADLKHFVARGMTPAQTELVRSHLNPQSRLFRQVLGKGGAQRLRDLDGDPTGADLPVSHPPINTFLAVPVKTTARTYGWLYFADKVGWDEFSEEDEQFATTLGSQLARVYENLLLDSELRARAAQLETEIVERRDVERALRESQSFLEQAQEVGGVGSWVSGVGEDKTLWWSRETYRIFGVTEHTPIDVDTFFAAVHPEDREALQRAVEKASASRTPYSGNHRIVLPDGSLRWVFERADVIFDADGRAIKLIGVVQDVTERREQQEKIVRLSRLYEVLSDINSTIVRVRERQALFEEACRIAVEHGKFGIAWIGLSQPGSSKVEPVAANGIELEALARLRTVAENGSGMDRGTVGDAIATGKASFCNEIETTRRADAGINRGYRSVIALPLLVDGVAAGVMVLYTHEVGFFDAEELKLLNELAGDISFGLQYIGKEERLNYLAYYDALTGLPNSTLFHDRLTLLLNGAKPDTEIVAVIVVDLDGFTQLNDTHGRHVGDLLLRMVAERLNSALPEPFSVARISADTFAVAVADLKQGADVADILNERLFDALHRPFPVGDAEVRISAHAGIALYPSDGADAGRLFKNAEAALRQARSAGERYLYYSPEIHASVALKLAFETRLRRAVEQRQFVLHYQPKFDTKTEGLLGLEGLIRWQDSEIGLVLPQQFIGVLEETGLILGVGEWVIDRALADYRTWRDKGLDPPRIAVNVSALQLRQPDFADRVRRALAARGVGPESLELELTESVIMKDIDTSIETLRRISDIGVTIAVDDFGTGYSSLRYLAKLPVDSLKIDQSFVFTMVASPDSMTIVSTIISLAHSLKLSVVAEGVEEREQVMILKELGCDEMQGHLFSRSLPPDRIETLLRDRLPV